METTIEEDFDIVRRKVEGIEEHEHALERIYSHWHTLARERLPGYPAWHLTNRFRWWVESRGHHRKLQQAWINHLTGELKWCEIPLVGPSVELEALKKPEG